MSLLARAMVRTWRAHPLRTVLILTAVALGVAAMVGTFAVNDRVLSAFTEVREAMRTAAPLHLISGGSGMSESIAEQAATAPGVERAIPLSISHFRLPNREGALMVIGVRPKDAEYLMNSWPDGPRLESKALQMFSLDVPVALSNAAADELLSDGIVSVLTPKGRRTLRVAATFDAGPLGELLGGRVAFTSLGFAQALAGRKGLVDRIEVFLESGAASAGEISKALRSKVPLGVQIVPKGAEGQGAESGFAHMRLGLLLAGMTALLAGVFLVYNVHSLNLEERRSEFATARALGASSGQILRPLLMEGLLLAGVGSVLGLWAGRSIATMAVAQVRDNLPLIGLPGRADGSVISASSIAIAVAVAVVATLGAVVIAALPALSQAPALSIRANIQQRQRALSIPSLLLVLLFLAMTVFAGILPTEGRLGGYLVVGILGISFALLGPLIARFLILPLRLLVRHWPLPRLAIEGLLRRPTRTGFTLSALGLAVALGVQSTTVVGSLERRILTWVDEAFVADLWLLSGAGRIAVGYNQPMDEMVVDKVAAIPGVKAARGAAGIFVLDENRDAFVYLTGIDIESWLDHIKLEWHAGSAETAEAKLMDGTGALVSDNYASLSGNRLGDTVTLPGSSGPYMLEIVGVVTDWTWAQGTIIVSREVLRTKHHLSSVDIVGAIFDADADADGVSVRIRDALGTQFDLHELSATEFREMVSGELSSLFSFATAQQSVVLIIAILAVMNTVALSILSRKDEWEWLGALGATPGQLCRCSMLEGAILATVAALAGLGLGLVVSKVLLADVLPRVSGWSLPVEPPYALLGFALLASVIVGCAAGFLGWKSTASHLRMRKK